MYDEACCTCARPLSTITPQYDEKTEKPTAQDRRLDCCNRIICGNCTTSNARFATYCTARSVKSQQVPPPSRKVSTNHQHTPPPPSPRPSNPHLASTPSTNPPAYSTIDPLTPPKEKHEVQHPADDVLHFLDPSKDSIPSLALSYGVPQDALRRKNNLFTDHLLAARKTILIPGEFYKGGVSLSPQPVEGEEEEKRKAKVRRWMVACKVAEYDVALLYLEQTKYELDLAVEMYLEDEKWEREHPMEGGSIAKGKKKGPRRRVFAGGGSLSGQV